MPFSITNLGKARNDLNKIPDSNIENKKAILDGKGCTLKLKFEDIRAFAYGEKGNVLDELDYICKLLAESILTRTTGHKVNDFRSVYYDVHTILLRYRSDFQKFFIDLRNEQLGDNDEERDKYNLILEKFKLLVGNKGRINSKEILIKEIVKIMELPEKGAKEFSKFLVKHFNALDKHMKKFEKILKNKKFKDAILNEAEGYERGDLVDAVADKFREVNIEVNKDVISNVIGDDSWHSKTLYKGLGGTQAAVGGVITTVGFILFGIVVWFFWPAGYVGLFLLAVGLTTMFAKRKDSTIYISDKLRSYKKKTIEMQKLISDILDEMGVIQRVFSDVLKKSLHQGKQLKLDETPEQYETDDFMVKVAMLITALETEWNRYATAEAKQYIDFSKTDMTKIIKDGNKFKLPIQKEGEKGKHWSGLIKKSNKNTSGIGLFKQGLARTLNHIVYFPIRKKSDLNLALD